MTDDDSTLSTAQAEREAVLPTRAIGSSGSTTSAGRATRSQRVAPTDSLAEIEMPPETEFGGYVVSDSDGVAHDHDDVAAAREDD